MHMPIWAQDDSEQPCGSSLERAGRLVRDWATITCLPARAHFLPSKSHPRVWECGVGKCDAYVRHPEDEAIGKKTRDAILSSSPSAHGAKWTASLAPPTHDEVENQLRNLINVSMSLSESAPLDAEAPKGDRSPPVSPTTVLNVL